MPGNGAAAGASYGDLLITSLLVLGAVCVAAFVAVRVFGRVLGAGRARGTHLLDVVARVPLEPRRSLYVVEVAGKTLLVGTSEMGLSVLSELDAGEVKSRVQAQPSFGELVRSAWLRRKARGARHPSGATDGASAHAGTSPAHEGASEPNGRAHVGTRSVLTDAHEGASEPNERAHVGTTSVATDTHEDASEPNERAHVGIADSSDTHVGTSEPRDRARDRAARTDSRAASST